MRYLPVIVLIFFLTSCEQSVIGEPPKTFTMEQNFPNPFTDTTVILYGVPAVTSGSGPWVRIEVKDRFNQTIATLVNRYNHDAGQFRIVWNGKDNNYSTVQSGIYYIELQEAIFGKTEVTVHIRKVAVKQ